MNVSAKSYSSFVALLIFFAAVAVMDLDQTITLHKKKLALMQEYEQTLKVQKQIDAQTKWVSSMREDLLRLAPGHPEASEIVTEMNLRPPKTGDAPAVK
jgi:hypothetical protein